MAKRVVRTASVSDVLAVLRAIAPEHLAEAWDKVGLHVGSHAQRVSHGLLCIDLTEPVMAEAIKRGANLVVAYHPPIFEPVARLTDATLKQRVLVEAVKRQIAIYSPHTALDAVRGGMTDWLCDGLGPSEARFAIEDRIVTNDHYKVVVFVPHDEADAVREAMLMEGAGDFGRYSGCSFNAEGFGTFTPGEGANPSVGKVGRFERVRELRLEMMCRAMDVGSVVRAIRATHSYEEPAIDVFKLAEDRPAQDEAAGAGRLTHLATPVPVATLVGRVKKMLGLPRVRVGAPAKARPIRVVAVCPGAGGSLFEGAEADAYLTGEMRHHQVLELVARGKTVVLTGHTHCERPYLPAYRERVAAGAAEAGFARVKWSVSKSDRCPWVDR